MNLLVQNTLEIALITSLTVLALFLSYSMLNVCDLSTDGCFTLGATVGAVVAISGHPFLSIVAALVAGMANGLVTGFLQTKMGIESLLAGIIVNTALYSVNIAVMGNASLLSMSRSVTILTMAKEALGKYYVIIVAAGFVAVTVVAMSLFLRTRLGLAIRATGDNKAMVQSSSIDPHKTILLGLCLSNSLTALSGCLLAQSQKSVNIDLGSGMVTIALASLLIGRSFPVRNTSNIFLRCLFSVLGAIIFRAIYTIALMLNMPAFMLKLVSAVIVALAIALPNLKNEYLTFVRKRDRKNA